MDALALLKRERDEVPGSPVPADDQGNFPPSNGQLRRWLQNGSVIINGARPGPEDEITFPITQLQFFPKRSRQTTITWE